MFSLHSLRERPHIDDLDALETDIDQLVCALCGLTKDDIALTEDHPVPRGYNPATTSSTAWGRKMMTVRADE